MFEVNMQAVLGYLQNICLWSLT